MFQLKALSSEAIPRSLQKAERYRLLNEATDVNDPPGTSPPKLVLLGSYPNPFAASTRIAFELPRKQEVSLRIFDVQGRKIREIAVPNPHAGKQEVIWDGMDDSGEDAPAGVYFYRFSTEGLVESKKLILRR